MKSVLLASLLAAPVMAGTAAGREALARVRSALNHPYPAVLCIDFSGMEIVTASAVRELTVPLGDACRQQGSLLVLANADETTTDEIRLVANAVRGVMITGKISRGQLTHPVVYGPLDEKLAFTFRLVLQEGEADAKTVHARSQEPTLVTVWNNRLVALEQMGLLAKRKVGKTNYYAPALEGMSYGC